MGRVEARGILRSHPFLLFVPTAALLVVATPALVLFAFRERDAMVAQLGISTASLFATLLALLAGAGSVVRDRDSGLEGMLLAGPLRPGAWLAGKWLGISGVVLLAVAILGGLHLLTLALRARLDGGGGPPLGYGPLVAALGIASVQGSLAAAVAIMFSSVLRAGPAFLAALVVLLAGHAAALLPEAALFDGLRFLLPRTPHLNLAGEAAFGPLPASLWLLALAHGTLYILFSLSLGARLLVRGGSIG